MSALASPIAVVTGASSGIGAATARRLAVEGYRVVLIARGKAELEVITRSIQTTGRGALMCPLDASDGSAVLSAAEEIRTQMGVPEVIVHCAGAGAWRFIEETSPSQMVTMMNAPFLAAFNVTHAFMPDLLQQGRGRLVFVGSPASAVPFPGATGYIAARWALRGLHEALCMDLAGTGVTSSHLVLGPVATPYMTKHPGSEQRMPWLFPKLVRTLQPEECAAAVVRLIERPQRTLVLPWTLRTLYWANAVCPGLLRALALRTGHPRAASF